MEKNTEFLQSKEWLRLQESVGKATIPFEEGNFVANGIIHTLPLIGNYVYVPRGPRQNNSQFPISNFQKNIQTLVDLAKEKGAKWIRIEPETEEILQKIKGSVPYELVRAPHDMQPREIFKIDISVSEEMLLAQMKPKTRYNIRLAEKHGVRVFVTREEKYVETFLDLITATSGRKGITSHSRGYYRQFFRTLPEEMCQLFVVEYEGVVLAENLVIFYGDTATYLHGGSSALHRDVMAPYLLQWEQIRAAQAHGYHTYDFGGVKTVNNQQPTTNNTSWEGITKFKSGFSSSTPSTLYPGAYDIILDTPTYFLYDSLRILKQWQKRIF